MNTLEKINTAILLATISYIIAINEVLANVDQIEPAMRWFTKLSTSVGLFRMLIIVIHWIIKNSDALLAVYHKGRFLEGLWAYRYEINGEAHVGIWRIAQETSSISIAGYGVDTSGKIDSHFRSISQIFEHQGVDEIMFSRTDTATGDEHYSKATLYVDSFSSPNRMSGPTLMRAQSVLYGYEEAGVRHADMIPKRVEPDKSEAEIVEELTKK